MSRTGPGCTGPAVRPSRIRPKRGDAAGAPPDKPAPSPIDPDAGAETGAVSLMAFTLLAVLSISAVAAMLLVLPVTARLRLTAERTRTETALYRQTESLIAALAADPTPEADAPIDPVRHAAMYENRDGCVMTLEDVSSRLNPNWVQRNLLASPLLATLLVPGRTADELQTYRHEYGFFLDIGSGYRDFFSTEVLDRYFSPYGYANVNVTDEFSLMDLVYLRTGEADTAEMVRERLRAAVVLRTLVNRDTLRELLGPAYGRVYPVVNVEPVWNVHFLPERLLRAVLAYPAFAVDPTGAKAGHLVSIRDSAELTAERLASILGADRSNRIHQYLGVTTWFWEITASRDGRTLRTVIARLPAEPDRQDTRPRFRVIEQRMLE